MIDRNLYPFKSNYFKLPEGLIHYVDVGTGPVILFSHGTPEWSFAYRNLIKALSENYRCIAIDHFGFGLSEKTEGADYSVRRQSERLELLIDHLGIKDINLVSNDFGLSIAVSYAIRHPENVSKLVIANGWMWSLSNEPHFAKPAKLLQGWLGTLLYRHLNFPIRVMMPQGYGNAKNYTADSKRHYEYPFQSKRDRSATLAYAHELINASDWWEQQWNQINTLDQKPFLIFWGMKDKFVRTQELERWKNKLKNYKLIVLPEAGHFVHEEAPDQMIQELQNFLS